MRKGVMVGCWRGREDIKKEKDVARGEGRVGGGEKDRNKWKMKGMMM